MADDSMFASDYDGPCPLCEDEGERHHLKIRVIERDRNGNEKREDAELQREQDDNDWTKEVDFIGKGRKEERTEHAKNKKENEEMEDENQELFVVVKTDSEYEHGEDAEEEMNEESKAGKLKVDKGIGKEDRLNPPLDEKSVMQLDSGCPVNLVMVCEERCVSEELMLCPSKSLTLPQISLISPPPSENPLPLTVLPSDPLLPPQQTQPVIPTQPSAQIPGRGVSCVGNPNHVQSNSPTAETRALAPPGQLEVTLRQVYTTRRYTRFTSRPAPLLPLPSVQADTSSQPLPYITSTSLLPPAPKKKTRTSYNTDQLEELERVFQDDHYPDAEKRKEIAISVGVTPQRVMVWFQNRRAKWRKTSKASVKKPQVNRAPAPAQTRPPAPVHRAPVFTAPTIIPSQTGNTLPPYSALLTSSTSPPGCVDANVCVSQGGSMDYKLPFMRSPPPLRRASLPFFAAYNPPTHTLSVLLDTPEHSEPQPHLHTDTGFDYDGMGSSAKLECMTSGPGNNAQPYQISAYPQQSGTLYTQQPNTLLAQQSNNISQLPQYSRLSYLTPSPYLTPNPSEGTTSSCLSLNPSTSSTLLGCTSGGHAYFQCQNNNQILMQPGVQALQAYPWSSDVYGHSAPVPHAVLRPQYVSQSCESHYPPLHPHQRYIIPQRASCPSLSKPAAPDPLMPSVKTELEDVGQNQPVRVSEAETVFHCDFSPIHF